MALGRQVIDLVRLYLLNNSNQAAGISEVTVMENEFTSGFVVILIEMVNTVGIEER